MQFSIIALLITCLMAPAVYPKLCTEGLYNCVNCLSDNCTQCDNGYVPGIGSVSGICYECPSDCESCSYDELPDDATCTSCDSGYELDDAGYYYECLSDCDGSPSSSSNWWIWVIVGVACVIFSVFLRICLVRRALARRQPPVIVVNGVRKPGRAGIGQAPVVFSGQNQQNQNQWDLQNQMFQQNQMNLQNQMIQQDQFNQQQMNVQNQMDMQNQIIQKAQFNQQTQWDQQNQMNQNDLWNQQNQWNNFNNPTVNY